MKKVIKITTIVLLVIMVLTTCVSATGYDWSGKLGEVYNEGGDANVNNAANNIIGSILDIARIIAVGVAIIMLIYLAMKYMMAAPSDRAEIKKSAVVYVVGATVLFASAGILTIIARFSSNIS